MKNKTKIGVIVLVSTIAMVYMAFLTSEPDLSPGLNPDSSTYLVLAKALATGAGYVNIDQECRELHTHFPFVFPALLAPFVRVFGLNILLLKWVIIIMAFGAFLCLTLLLLRMNSGNAIPVLLLTMVSPWIFRFSHAIMSEIPYLLFSLLAVRSALRYEKKEHWLNRSGALTLLFLFLACFTRSVGVSLVFATVAGLLFGPDRTALRYKKAVFIIAGFGICLLAGRMMTHLASLHSSATGGTYLNEFFIDPYDPSGKMTFFNLPLRLVHNGYAIALYGIPNILAGMQFSGRSAASILLLTFTVLGLFSRFIKNRSIIEWYFVFFLLLLLVWPWTRVHGTRFLVPLAPFVFFYFLAGAATADTMLRAKGFLAGLFIILFFVNTAFTVRFAAAECNKNWSEKPSGRYVAMADHIKKESPADAIFITSGSQALYLWGERRSACGNFTTVSGLSAMVRANRGGYLIIDPENDHPSFGAVIERNPEWFSTWYAKGNLSVHKIR